MKRTLLSVLFILSSVLLVNAQSYAWAKKAGAAANYEQAKAIYVDAAGNSYITGIFRDTINFGTITLLGNSFVPANYTDMFVAKYDASGNVLWAKMASAIVDDGGFAICADNSGNVYVGGYFNKNGSNPTTMTFGALPPISCTGWDDIFLVKYDASGTEQWAKAIGGGSNDYAYDLVADNAGSVYMTGKFEGSVNFGTATLSSSGWGDVYVAKFDVSNGNNLWAVKAGGSGDDCAYGLERDGAGNLYITGFFRSTCTFGSAGSVSSSGVEDAFIAKLDPNGTFLWVKKGGGSLKDEGRGVVIDGAGSVYITGTVGGNATFNTTTLTSNGGFDVFIAKYDASGNLTWAMGEGGVGNDKAFGICRDSQGGVYISGSFEQTATFGTNTIVVQGISDVFTAKYDPNTGSNVWAIPGGAEDEDASHGIGIDASDDLYIAGYFRTQAFFGTQLTASVLDEVFVVKIDNALSVEDIEANSIYVSVYPNPASTIVNVNVSEEFFTKGSTYEIKDIAGKVVAAEKLSSAQTAIDLSALPAGVYLLSVITDKGTAVKQVIKR